MAELDFGRALAYLRGERTVAVCGHVNPDGDSVGSVLALTLVLRKLGMQATPLLATRECPPTYDFLPGYGDLTPACDYDETPDVFISVDVPNVKRTVDGARVFERAHKRIAIDHHQGEADFADMSFVDADAAAAGMLIWDFACQAGIEDDADIATCCYTALVTDTGRFQFQNADAAAFEHAAAMVHAGADPGAIARAVYQRSSMAALQLRSRALKRMQLVCGGRAVLSYVRESDFASLDAKPDDAESLVDSIRELGGVDVVVMLREQGPIIRGSLRAKGDFDVSVVAAEFGGGGHAAASGFTIRDGFEAARVAVIEELAAALDEAGIPKRITTR